jgi:isopentenyl-diphosphate delta-isomerase
MVLDAVDSSDRVVGTVPRRELIRVGANFRVVHVFVFNTQRELLLQRIAKGLRHEGQWGASAAGYLYSGEAYDQAAARKLHAELGVTATLIDRGKTSMIDRGSTKFIALYEVAHSGPFHPEPNEVSEVAFTSLQAIASDRVSGARVFTSTFLHLLDFYQSRSLQP